MINLYIDEPTCGPIEELPLVNRLFSHSRYLDSYHGYLKSLLEGPFKYNRLASRINELANLIRPFVESDELKFFSTADFERGLNEGLERGKIKRGMPMHVPGLKSFIFKRSESIRQQLEGNRPKTRDGNGNEGRSLSMR